MQIYNNAQNSNLSTPNFKAIKSFKYEGLYKKYPQHAQKIVDTFYSNPIAMNFCKKHDVNIVLYACKKAMTAVKASILIFFNNPAKEKFLGIFGNTKDKIYLSQYANEYNIENSLEISSSNLNKFIEPKNSEEYCGVLDSHIAQKEEEIAAVLAKKHKKEAEKMEKNKLKENLEIKRITDTKTLNESIKKLMDESK